MNNRPARIRFAGRIAGEGISPSPIAEYLAVHWDGQGVYAAAQCSDCQRWLMLGLPAGSGEPRCPDAACAGHLSFTPPAEIGFPATEPDRG